MTTNLKKTILNPVDPFSLVPVVSLIPDSPLKTNQTLDDYNLTSLNTSLFARLERVREEILRQSDPKLLRSLQTQEAMLVEVLLLTQDLTKATE